MNYLFEVGADMFPMIKNAQGVYLTDETGKKYLDFAAATFNLSLGYNHPLVTKAVMEQVQSVCYASSSFNHGTVMAFAKKLVGLCPDNLTKVHPKCTGGSTANEGAVKAALKVTGKNDIVSYYYGYHGQTYLAQAITGYHSQRKSLPPIGLNIIRIPFPYCYRCFFGQRYPGCDLMCLEKNIDILDVSSTNGPACLIMEPILGIGGCVVPPMEYMTELSDFCLQKNIPLIMDEVMTGIGRTGKMFAFEHFGIRPNILTLGKGLGGSGFGSTAIVAEERFTALTDYEHSFTASNYLIGAAAAVATLNIIDDQLFLGHVEKMGAVIKSKLFDFKDRFSFIGDVRGLGLMQGMEIVGINGEPDTARAIRITKMALKRGLFLRCYQHALTNTILLTPALIITESEVCKGLDIIEELLIIESKK